MSPESSSAQALGSALEIPGHKINTFRTLREALQAVRCDPPDLVLADMRLSATDGFQLMEQISIEKLPVDVFAILPADQPDLACLCLKGGAVGCLTPPFDVEMLRIVIRQTGEKQNIKRENLNLRTQLDDRTAELIDMHDSFNQMFRSSMDTLLRALDWRERETKSHSCRVALAAVAIARELNLDRSLMRRVLIGGLLHDIGKIGVPDSILMKPGPLTSEEWESMRCHPEMGCDIVMKTALLGDARDVVLHHHERFDATGYPDKLGTDAIPM
ncbi:MAG: HD domain-containing protein, partial [Armatimonadota bacterium]|nr:HD domain-containing protein [Armatimonadota bacterium]